GRRLRRLLRLRPPPERPRPRIHRRRPLMSAQKTEDRAPAGPTTPEADRSAPLNPFCSCPLPIFGQPQSVLGHGSGGKLSAEHIDKVFVSRFRNPTLDRMDDQAILDIAGTRLAFTTDSFIFTPIFFPRGALRS